MNRQITFAAAAGLLLIVAVWAFTEDGIGAKLKGQVEFAAGSAEPEPAAEAPMRTGKSPGRYGPPCPLEGIPEAVRGPHPLKRHPKQCSPRMSAVMRMDHEWMFCPPSEDDL